MDFRNSSVGQVYLTKKLGTVSYRPKIRTKVGSLTSTQSADLFQNIVAVDVTGVESTVAEDIAIDYSTSTGYRISAANVRRNGRFVVTQTNAAIPGNTYTGSIKVSLILLGYTAGYNLGASYYSVDYTAVASAPDTLAPSGTNRAANALRSNKVPAVYRPPGENLSRI